MTLECYRVYEVRVSAFFLFALPSGVSFVMRAKRICARVARTRECGYSWWMVLIAGIKLTELSLPRCASMPRVRREQVSFCVPVRWKNNWGMRYERTLMWECIPQHARWEFDIWAYENAWIMRVIAFFWNISSIRGHNEIILSIHVVIILIWKNNADLVCHNYESVF